MMMRLVLVENIGPTLDAALFSAVAAAPGMPAGVLNGVAAIAPSAATVAIDAMVADIAAIATALAPAAGASQPMIIAAPAQAAALTLRAPRDLWPVLMSSALPNKTVIGIVPSALASVVEAPRIEAGAGMAHMDSAPGEIVDVGGVLAHPVRSFWQTDSVGLRFILPATWAMRSPRGVAWIQTTNW
jgi:hypothetical protein